MKNAAMALPILGLLLGFTAPAGAMVSKSLILKSASDMSIVQQQSTCKEGETWDEAERKCKKNEG